MGSHMEHPVVGLIPGIMGILDGASADKLATALAIAATCVNGEVISAEKMPGLTL